MEVILYLKEDEMIWDWRFEIDDFWSFYTLRFHSSV